MIRTYTVKEEDGFVLVLLFEDGEQVGRGSFPDDGSGEAFDSACEVGEEFLGNVF